MLVLTGAWVKVLGDGQLSEGGIQSYPQASSVKYVLDSVLREENGL